MKVLVTGGASGLGEAVTRRSVRDPQCLVYFTFHDSRESALGIAEAFPNAHALECDFRDPAAVDSLQERIRQLDIDILVNNAYAGTFLAAHFHKTDPEDFLAGFRENILPTVIITQAAIRCFRKKKQGRIITISTSALRHPPPIGSSVYAANKAYLQEMVKVWAVENAKFNIASNSVSPSFMSTPFTLGMDPRIIGNMIEGHPGKRPLTVEEAAEAVFSLYHAPLHVNGTDIPLEPAAPPE